LEPEFAPGAGRRVDALRSSSPTWRSVVPRAAASRDTTFQAWFQSELSLAFAPSGSIFDMAMIQQ
jgi:hypothetical protein